MKLEYFQLEEVFNLLTDSDFPIPEVVLIDAMDFLRSFRMKLTMREHLVWLITLKTCYITERRHKSKFPL
jgi:hypothetical protein